MRYCRGMLSRRLYLRIDEARYCELSEEAKRRGVSMAAVVRDVIDRLPLIPDEQRRAAIDAILRAEPIRLPADPAELRGELDDAHDQIDA